MAVVTVDPVNLLFVEIATTDDSSIDALEIYNDWKDWMLDAFQNMGHPIAFTLDGATDLPGGGTNAPYFFLQGGWKIQPADRISTGGRLRIIGNLYAGDGSSIYVEAASGPSLQVETEVSPQALQVGGALTVQGIVDGVWDEVNTGVTHNVNNSTGKQLRQVKSLVIRDGTAQAGTSNTITLDVAASAVDGQYDPSQITIIGNTGADQSRQIIAYDGATKIAVVDRDWRVIPDSSSEFVLQAVAGYTPHVNEGLAKAATANTITLNDTASAVDDTYVEQLVSIRSGTGQHQVRRVIGYDGATKIATVLESWTEIPDTTSGYVMLPDSDGTVALSFMQVARGAGAGVLEIDAFSYRGAQAAGFSPGRSTPIAITIDWYDSDGSLLFTLTEADATVGQDPDSQNHYRFSTTQAAVLDNVLYYAVVSITDGAGVVSNSVTAKLGSGDLVAEIWQRLGLDGSNPMATSDTQITVGGIVIDISDVGGVLTLTRA